MFRLKFALVALLAPCLATAALAADVRREIQFPDVGGYQTLVCDFHMHTVFSDGQVWPPVRVKEAWSQGLDAIALTDHIEYQ
ncbi:MAG: PHP domain-containing protein, partial [Planctomycetota bacterium]